MKRKQLGKKRTRALVLGYLERLASSAFDEYPQQIRELVHGKHGVYALYKGDRLYYVGLATNLRNRVKHHLKDKLAGKWNRFSLYLVRKVEHIKELESLVLRIATPKGNTSGGRLSGAKDLWSELHDKIRQKQNLQIQKLHEEKEKPGRRTRRPGSNSQVYNAAFYKSERNNKSVDAFMQYADDLATLVEKHDWQLERKFNRGYCGFKAGFFNTFGINWWGSKTFGLFVKISQAEASRLKPRPLNYSTRWKEAHYPIEPGKTRLSTFLPALDLAYHKLAGKSET